MWRAGRSGWRFALVAGWVVMGAAWGHGQDVSPMPDVPAAEVPALDSVAGDVATYADVFGGEEAMSASGVVPEPPPPEPPFGVTGDWLGARTSLAERGIQLRTNFSQFYQGLTSGGLRQDFRYGLKFDYFGVIEGEKLLGVKGLLVNLHGESRFGESVNNIDGALLPSNFALQFPKGRGAASALTGVQISQFLSENWMLTFGKLNMADLVNVHPFMGGNGVDRFMNTAFILNPAYGRAIPYSTPGAGVIYLRNMDPMFTLMVMDPMGRPDTSGFDRMFRNGASIFAQARIPVAPGGLPGHQGFEGVWSSGKFNPLSGDDYVILPDVGLVAQRQTGTWLISYVFDQYLVVREENPRQGWGVFGNLTLTDGDPNPIRWFMNIGVGGTSPLAGREKDSFGLAYYYLGTSDALQATLDRVFPIRNEQGFELYYNVSVTDWFVLTADIQAMDPARHDAASSFLFGLRGKIVF